MRANGLLALALAASSVLGAVLPKHEPASTQALDARAEEEYRAELEARGLHPACIISMATCLAGYGLLGFKYQETKLARNYLKPWDICGAAAIFSGNCIDGIGNQVKSEPDQMIIWYREHGLLETDPINCHLHACPDDDDLVCEHQGCDFCFADGYCFGG